MRGLPTPADLPTADVVIYDGECRFCQAQVARIHAWDGRGRLAFVSLHDPLVAQRWPQLTHQQLMAEMHLVTAAGQIYRGAQSLRYLTRRLPWLWWLAPALHIPGTLPLWNWLYGLVARNRYRWGKVESCADGNCKVHLRK
ncbi:MAG: DUF393 domain-containing protein [Pirellulales bacterium]|nr:DUF393 domain-containing protein [Pirellulales bacterium]